MTLGFNRPYLTGREFEYIENAVERRHLSGNGYYSQECQRLLEERYGFKKCLLTTSCTDALEMAAILIDVQPGDEIIVPSFTFVSTANAFVLRGAKIVFADSSVVSPNLDVRTIESLITPRTKAIVPVHYAGMPCDMDLLMEIADKNNCFVIEDAAQAIDSYLGNRAMGTFGHLSAFSFHETKNIQCGEGGMLAINDERFIKRAEIIRDKGTNRASFFRGEVNKYEWVDIGSSFLLSDLNAAFLYAQLEGLDFIQDARRKIWDRYYEGLLDLAEEGKICLPMKHQNGNAHMFYLVCKTEAERTALAEYLALHDIQAVFHYMSLHSSPYFESQHDGRDLPFSDHYSGCLLRLPFWIGMEDRINFITDRIKRFFEKLNKMEK